MRYSTGQDIREGDEVWLEARDWAPPDGGVLVKRDGLGLAPATHPEKDANLVLIRRSS